MESGPRGKLIPSNDWLPWMFEGHSSTEEPDYR